MNRTIMKPVGVHVRDCEKPNCFQLVFTDGENTEIGAYIDTEEMYVVCVDVDAISKLKPIKELLENILEKENKDNGKSTFN